MSSPSPSHAEAPQNPVSQVSAETETAEEAVQEEESVETKQIRLLTEKLLEARELLRQLTTENAQLKQLIQQQANDQANQEVNQHASEEVDKLKKEVERLRAHLLEANDSQTTEQLSLESHINQLETELHASKQLADSYKLELDGIKAKTGDKDLELDAAKEQVKKWKEEWQNQSTALENLQTVLEQFSACKNSPAWTNELVAKEAEIGFATDSLKSQLSKANLDLEHFKSRALAAEKQVEAQRGVSVETLQAELAEKNGVIGKLRHDVIVIQNHLNESLKRLKESSDNSVSSMDRRILTNLFVQFLSLPPRDTKRSEILKIMSEMLSFSDSEKEKVGLVRPRDKLARTGSDGVTSPVEQAEKFTELWVEFLMREAKVDQVKQTTGQKQPERKSSFFDKILGKSSSDAPATPTTPASPHNASEASEHSNGTTGALELKT